MSLSGFLRRLVGGGDPPTPAPPPATAPATYLFWVPFDTVDDDDSASQPMPIEQIVQDALRDTVESLALERSVQQTAMAEVAQMPAPVPPEPLPEPAYQPAVEPSPEPAAVEAMQPAEPPPPPRKSKAKKTPKPTKRKSREETALSSDADSSPIPESQPSTRRVRVQRNLHWPEDAGSDTPS